MASLLQYKDNLLKYNACARYMRPLQQAISDGDKEQLVKLATDINGADVTCDSYAFGWGLDGKIYNRDFGHLLGPEKNIIQKGYESMLIVEQECEILPSCQIIIVLGGRVVINTKPKHIYHIFIANASVDIKGEGFIECVKCYGASNIVYHGNVEYNEYHEIATSNWMSNESK